MEIHSTAQDISPKTTKVNFIDALEEKSGLSKSLAYLICSHEMSRYFHLDQNDETTDGQTELSEEPCRNTSMAKSQLLLNQYNINTKQLNICPNDSVIIWLTLVP